jgi:hypothetical protein
MLRTRDGALRVHVAPETSFVFVVRNNRRHRSLVAINLAIRPDGFRKLSDGDRLQPILPRNDKSDVEEISDNPSRAIIERGVGPFVLPHLSVRTADKNPLLDKA